MLRIGVRSGAPLSTSPLPQLPRTTFNTTAVPFRAPLRPLLSLPLLRWLYSLLSDLETLPSPTTPVSSAAI